MPHPSAPAQRSSLPHSILTLALTLVGTAAPAAAQSLQPRSDAALAFQQVGAVTRTDQSDGGSILGVLSGARNLGSSSDVGIARVTATGPGCPSGSWNVLLEPTGRGFVVDLRALATTLSPQQAESSNWCRLTVTVQSPDGARSYRVGRFAYAGYAFLPSGVTGQFVTDYSFADDPSSGFSVITDLAGPLDKDYTVTDQVDGDVLWSPCSRSSTIYVDMTLQLQNGAARTNAVLDVGYVAGLELDARSCR